MYMHICVYTLILHKRRQQIPSTNDSPSTAFRFAKANSLDAAAHAAPDCNITLKPTFTTQKRVSTHPSKLEIVERHIFS